MNENEETVELLLQAPSPEALQASERLLGTARSWKVVSSGTYEEAASLLRDIKGLATALDEERKDATKPLDRHKKSIMAAYAVPLTRLESAEAMLKGSIATYVRAQERAALEAQAAANAAAREARVKLEERANKAIERGNLDKAEALEQEAATIVAPIVEADVPKVGGLAIKHVWRFRITNEALVPDEYKVVNEKMIAGVVRAMGRNTNIPGVEVFEADQVASRR